MYDVRRVLRPRKDDPDRLANAVRYTVAIDAGTQADMRAVLAELVEAWTAESGAAE